MNAVTSGGWLASLAVAASLLGAAARPADACTILPLPEHQLDPAHAGDATPPSTVTVVEAYVHRRDDGGCNAEPSQDCGLRATVVAKIDAADDATGADELGYEVRVVGGDPPPGLDLPSTAVRRLGGVLWFSFDHEHESGFDIVLEIRAVDLNGNRGPPVTFSVGEPGDSGCSTSGRPGHAATLGGVLLALLAVLARRRR
jgi:uncharacterized protein (TIGR03382 family)